ncbi:MAG: hypothetical protein NVS2B3_04340 [Vulcanimicrobiaceae bacterium]
MSGLDPSALEGDTFARALHEDDLARARSAWQHARNGETSYRQDVRMRAANGGYRWFCDRAEPVRADDGTTRWFGTLTDIHDGRAVETALVERSQFVDRVLEASDDCIKVLDLGAGIRSMNPSGLKAFGIADFETMRGANWLDLWAGENRQAAERAIATAVAGSRGRFTGRMSIEGVERSWDVGVTAVPGPDGTPAYLLVVSRDVSEIVDATRSLAQRTERDRLVNASLPGVTWTATPDGLLDRIGTSPASNDRRSLPSRLGTGWLEAVHHEDRARARELWAASVSSGDPYEATFRVLVRDALYRWQLVRALPQRDESGAIVLWVGVNIDIDDRVRADEAREMFVALAENSGDLVAIAETDGTHLYMNPAGRELVGISGTRRRSLFDLFAGVDAGTVRSVVLPLVASTGRWSGELHVRDLQTAKRVPIACNAFQLTSADGRHLGVAMIGRDLRGRRRLESNMRALAQAGSAMHGTLDFDGTIGNVAEAVVREFASYAIVDAYDASGARRIAAAAQRRTDAVSLLERIALQRRELPNHPATRALEHGEATLVASVSSDWLDSIGVRRAIPAMDRLDFRSMIVVPIRSTRDDRIVGSLTFVRDGADVRGPYIADDLRFAEEIARRAGTAFDNASAFEHERRIAVALQEASLPRELPALATLQLSAAYRPGDSEATIGGDWYDAFALPDGRIVVTIGDVLGHGLHAAVTMGKVRQAMQSVAMVADDFATILAAADRTVRAQSSDTYATALVGIFDLQRDEFRFASAGHPGPIVREPGGAVREVTAYGMMLGLRQAGPQAAVTIAVPPGSTLVFFTDGLVETTHDIDAGHARLRDAVTDPSFAHASDGARALVERVLGGVTASDDIAVLVARVGPRAAMSPPEVPLLDATTGRVPTISHGRATVPQSHSLGRLVLVVLARYEDVSRSRSAIRERVAACGAPHDAVALAELAAGELVGNAVDHGNGAAVEVVMQTFADRAVIEVTNAGELFERPSKPFEEMLFEQHGRGLALLTAFGCQLSVHAPEPGRCTVTATIPFATAPAT